ncbi:DNA/RNA polymerases superfamily protein [Gossypium australe]|uniref:DNA/RNA polymerases superfamily protein n=1 Tax=Gossypium australe TaxID=47621 RepID=A0A5B6UZT2_9ROSI|nr:DNA/RNA polymerases superfamily protein [Gossypium australe]
MTPYEALYGRKCRTPLSWTKLGGKKILGLNLVQETENIQSSVLGIEFSLSFHCEKKVPRFGCKGKVSPRVGQEAYQELHLELDCIHDVFHVFMLMRYHSISSYVIPINEVNVQLDLSYEEEPVQILD